MLIKGKTLYQGEMIAKQKHGKNATLVHVHLLRENFHFAPVWLNLRIIEKKIFKFRQCIFAISK